MSNILNKADFAFALYLKMNGNGVWLLGHSFTKQELYTAISLQVMAAVPLIHILPAYLNSFFSVQSLFSMMQPHLPMEKNTGMLTLANSMFETRSSGLSCQLRPT